MAFAIDAWFERLYIYERCVFSEFINAREDCDSSVTEFQHAK